ncbi:DUF349 domain-containing protein [Balneolales bacterium ANBcel1]|nr:DUF349 domain-containing protein [Balneolales bacterium ANBcel1]
MEREHVTVTDDGRIRQKDGANFSGRELARVEPDAADEAVTYFENRFTELEKYVNTELLRLKQVTINDDLKASLAQLREEILSAKAIGDFEALLGKVEGLASQPDQEKSEPEETSEKPAELTENADAPVENDSKASEVTSEPEESTAEVSESAEAPAASADGKPESAEEPAESSGTEPQEKRREDLPESLAPLAALASHARDLARQNDWMHGQAGFEQIQEKWQDIVAADESLASEPGYADLLKERDDARKQFTERKEAWHQKKKERKKANLEKRERLLEQLQEVINKKKWQAIKQVNSISSRWEEIKDLPGGDEASAQEKRFADLLQQFNENKVAFLVKKAEKEEANLAGKLAVLDKMKQLVAALGPDTENWDQRDAEMELLSKQWKKIGHVPMEQSEGVWEQFKSVRDEFFNRKYEHNEKFRKQTKKNIQKKIRMCEKAEALAEEKDLALAVREMNNLHKNWKNTGAVPKEKNDELWERFNEATRKFNKIKSENQDVIRRQEQENLAQKVALCEKAEELKESTNWNETSAELENLMKQWKETGPVSRRKSNKLWSRFKKAMDAFYDNRRKHYRVVREDQKANYEKKRGIVSEIEKLAGQENVEEALEQVKELQEQFKKIGFVPIKKKSRLDSDYKAACDTFYDKLRATTRGRSESTGKEPVSGRAGKGARDEYFKLKKECDKMHEEIMRYKDTMTFINPGGKGNALIDDIQKKIDKEQNKLNAKLEKLEDLRQKMEE